MRVVFTEYYLRINLCFIKGVMPYQIFPVRTIFDKAPRFNASVTYFEDLLVLSPCLLPKKILIRFCQKFELQL